MRPDQDALAQGPAVRTVLGPLVCTAAIHLAALVCYVGGFGGDLSALVCVDQGKAGKYPYENVETGFAKGGYDGQFYYVLARDPFAIHDRGVIDLPAYRQTRILYPALAWIGSGGNPALLLWVLPGLNLAAIVGLAWVGARLALHHRRSPWWGCLLPIVLNAGLPALRDLTDPVAAAAAGVLLAAHLLNWPTWTLAVWGAAAALSREQNIAILLLILADAALQQRWGRVVALVAAVLPALGWILALRGVYGQWPVASGNVCPPGAGIWYGLNHLAGCHGSPPLLNGAGLSMLLLQLAVGVLAVTRAQRLTAGLTLAGIGLALLGGVAIYESGYSYARVFFWLPLGIWLWGIQSGRSWPVLLLVPSAFWFVLAAMQPWIC